MVGTSVNYSGLCCLQTLHYLSSKLDEVCFLKNIKNLIHHFKTFNLFIIFQILSSEPTCVYLKSLILLNPKHQVDLTIWVPWNSIIKRVENIGQTLVIQLLHNIASVLHFVSSFVHLYMCLRMRMCVYL